MPCRQARRADTPSGSADRPIPRSDRPDHVLIHAWTVAGLLYHAKYTATVYEAKTGKEAGSVSIDAKNDKCPSVALTDGDDPKVFSIPTSGADRAGLGGSARQL